MVAVVVTEDPRTYGAAVDVVDSTSLAAALDGGHGGLNALLRGRGHSPLRAETLAVCVRLLRTQSYCLE